MLKNTGIYHTLVVFQTIKDIRRVVRRRKYQISRRILTSKEGEFLT